MAEQNAWVKVGGGSDDSQKEFKNWDFRTDKEIEGIYRGARDITRKDNTTATVYDIETADGLVSVWSYVGMVGSMKKVGLGSQVKIVYLGLQQSPKNPTRKFHNFEVYQQPAQNNADELPFD